MDAITRNEIYLNAVADGSKTPEPITRKEFFLAKMAGEDVTIPTPVTREEMFLQNVIEKGGGGEAATLITKTVTANGTYKATSDNADGYSEVTVNVAKSGSGITKETVQYTIGTSSYSHYVPISGDVNKILFVHFYDPSAIEAYPTNNTTYEGMKLGPATVKTSGLQSSTNWCNWRTNSSGSNGFNPYGTVSAFGTAGKVGISANPALKQGNTIIVEIYYED